MWGDPSPFGVISFFSSQTTPLQDRVSACQLQLIPILARGGGPQHTSICPHKVLMNSLFSAHVADIKRASDGDTTLAVNNPICACPLNPFWHNSAQHAAAVMTAEYLLRNQYFRGILSFTQIPMQRHHSPAVTGLSGKTLVKKIAVGLNKRCSTNMILAGCAAQISVLSFHDEANANAMQSPLLHGIKNKEFATATTTAAAAAVHCLHCESKIEKR